MFIAAEPDYYEHLGIETKKFLRELITLRLQGKLSKDTIKISSWKQYSGELDKDGKAYGYGRSGEYTGTWRHNKMHGFGK